DGFTLRDLVSYNDKHNEANGEENRDGENHNRSWNCGEEGPSNNPAVNALRNRQVRNFLTTLLLSQGVPMICGGDEIGRTQQGNNNGYCQDNEISWYDWELTARNEALLDFTRRLIRLRREHPVLRRRKFFQGNRLHDSELGDIEFFQPDGSPMNDEHWEQGWIRTMGMLLNGRAMAETDERGRPIEDDVLLLLVNGDSSDQLFTLPANSLAREWRVLVDTNSPGEPDREVPAGEEYRLQPRTLALLAAVAPEVP
ncbi:MAG TPA: glycogen debranching enzyme GlgX, partial [Trueperaceae bacterium]